MTALVIGGTGLVGKRLLELLATQSEYTEIISLVRTVDHSLPNSINQIIIDFNQPKIDHLKPDVLFCCLGTTIKKAGSKAAFKKVDVEYPYLFAQKAYKLGAQKCCIVTAMGASEKSYFFYNRAKGEVERLLSTIGFDALGIFRPSMLLGDRKENRIGEKLGKIFIHILNPITPNKYKAIHDHQVAQAMISFSLAKNQGVHSIENDEMLFPA